MIGLGCDHLGVEAKGHLRVGMARLRHDVGHIGPRCEQEGNEGAAQRVRRHVRHHLPPRRSQIGVGELRGRIQEAVADVGGVVSPPRASREDQIPGLRVRAAAPVVGEQFLKRGSQIDLANACVGLRRRDTQAARVEVYVPPAQIKRLADPQARQRQSREQRTAAASRASASILPPARPSRSARNQAGRASPRRALFPLESIGTT